MSEPLSQTELDFALSQIHNSSTSCNVMEIIQNYPITQAVTIISKLDLSLATTVLLFFCVQASRGSAYAKELLANAIALGIQGTECVTHAYGEHE